MCFIHVSVSMCGLYLDLPVGADISPLFSQPLPLSVLMQEESPNSWGEESLKNRGKNYTSGSSSWWARKLRSKG